MTFPWPQDSALSELTSGISLYSGRGFPYRVGRGNLGGCENILLRLWKTGCGSFIKWLPWAGEEVLAAHKLAARESMINHRKSI